MEGGRGVRIIGLDFWVFYADLGGNGQMGSLGLEAILVSDVSHGVDDTVRAGVGVRAAHRDALVLSASVLDLS